MLQPVDDAARRRMRTCSAALCLLSAIAAPLAARSSRLLAPAREASVAAFVSARLPDRVPARTITVRRDPFAADRSAVPGTVSPELASGTGAGDSIVGMRVVQGTPTGIALPGAAVVRAIVTGSGPPRAIVDEGGTTRTVTLGDRVAGSRVIGIGTAGLVLRTGARVPVAPDSP